MDKGESILKSEDKKDLISKTKTIYEARPVEIFWKNFLAGFSRGLGGIFVYIIFLIIIGWVMVNFALPKIMPAITNLMNLSKSLESVSRIKSGPANLIPENLDLQKLLGK